MIKKTPCYLLGFFSLLCVSFVSNALATVIIDAVSDEFTTGIGNYTKVTGFAEPSAPGLVYEVLGGPQGTLQHTDPEYETRNINMSILWNLLNNKQITSANVLTFGFGLNESSPKGSNSVSIDELDMQFVKPNSGGLVNYSLGADKIQVYNYKQGASTGEALIYVSLPFNFMGVYSATSTELFTIHSSISGGDSGFEIYFLSNGLYDGNGGGGGGGSSAVPEPATMALMGFGLMGIALVARKRNR